MSLLDNVGHDDCGVCYGRGYRTEGGYAVPCNVCATRNGPSPIDTSTLGPVRTPSPTHRQADAKLVREALEASALVETNPDIVVALYAVARGANTETLAYIRRLLK